MVNLLCQAKEPGVYSEGQRKPLNVAFEKDQYVQVISGKQEIQGRETSN